MEIRRYITTLLVALSGVLLGLVLWHLWNDHLLADEIRAARLAAQAQQAQQIQQFQQQQRAKP